MSRGYRSGGYNSNVDESLFGKPARKTMIGRAALPANSVVVSTAQIQGIKDRSILRSQADEMRERSMREAEFEEKQAISRARKERMLKMEAEAKSKAKKSDIEIAKVERERTIRDLAEKQVDENLDMVKMLNTLGARAAAFTVRDQQLADLEQRAHVGGDYDKRMDLMMEMDRLKELAERERIEESKREQRIADREVIVGQIKTREKARLLEGEARERENQQMKQLMKKYEDEDREKAEKRKLDVERSKQEIMAANAESIRRKDDAKLKELQEAEYLKMYQMKKDADLAAREKFEQELADEKRETQAKLLAQQEKSQNKQSEIDELRARRYAEEGERRARNEVKAKAEKKRQQMIELMKERSHQAESKKSIIAREAVMQQQEYEDAIRYGIKDQQREAAEEEAKHHAMEMHRIKLQEQIDRRASEKKLSSLVKYDEGQKLKNEFAAERAKLGAIRDKMVDDLRKKGINPKYLSEMQMCDIEKIQMR